MLRNSRADDGLKYWTEENGRLGFTNHQFYFNGQKRMFELRPGAIVKSPRFIVKRGADYTLNVLGFDTNSKYFKIYFCKRKKGSTVDFEEKQLVFDGSPRWTEGPVFDNSKALKKSFRFNIGDFDDGYLQFEYDRNNPNKWGGLFMTELDFYEGSNDRKWQPCPDDSNEPLEAVRTQVTQLGGSWSVRNLNSASDILGQMNLNPDGSVRINEGLLSIGEKTYIKDGVIKKSMIGKAQIGTAHIDEIDASKANLINVTSKNVATEGLTANIIKGGKLSSLNGATNFDLNQGVFKSMGEKTGLVLHGGALDFIEKSGRSIAGYSTFYSNGRVAGGAIGSHDGYDFYISTKSGGRPMITCTNDNKIKMTANTLVLDGEMTIVSTSSNINEYVGIKLKRYNQGGGWCTAFVNSQSNSGIEFYDNGNVRILRYGQIWEPSS